MLGAWWQQEKLQANCLTSVEVSSEEALLLLTPSKDNDSCADILGLATAQMCNKKSRSSSIPVPGPGARLSVEYSHYSKGSGQGGHRTSNELQMAKYSMEQLCFPSAILSDPRCFVNCFFLNLVGFFKEKNVTTVGLKHLGFNCLQ